MAATPDPVASGRTIAVAGSSGPLGAAVLGRLDMDPGAGRVIAIEDAELLEGDLKRRLEGADGLVSVPWFQLPGFRAEGIRRLLDAAGSSGVRHLVHLSSATVYGAWPDNPVPLSEDALLRPNPGFAYASEHAEAERIVADWRDGHAGCSAAVLRPAVTVGGGCDTALARAVAGLVPLRPGDSTRPVQILHVDDLVTALLLALRRSVNGTRNVAPDGWTTEETARALAGGAARVRLPTRLAAPARWFTPARLSGYEPYAEHPWVVANDLLQADGWDPSHTSEEAFVLASAGSRMELSPRRRQELLLGAAGTLLAGAAAGVVAVARRRRRHRFR